MFISLIRTFIIYILIILSIRIMGKRQISELQTTELVVTLLISDLAVIPMQDSGQPLTSGLVPILVLVSVEIFLSIFMLKNRNLRKIICGRPVLLINDGVLLQDAMRELRMSTEDLFENLRQKDIFNLDEVKYAIIETNGLISILKKEDYESPLNKDFNLIPDANELSLVIVSDGEICSYSLAICGLDEDFIHDITEKENIALSDIYILTADRSHNYTLIKKGSGS